MELNLKGLGKKDTLNLKTIEKERKKIIQSSDDGKINTKFHMNDLANSLHPDVQHVKVAEIIEESNDAKTFILVPDVNAGTKKLAYFRAGQYVTVKVKIDGCTYTRPYTISCSPKNVLDNIYTITVKKRPKGIVSSYFIDNVQIDDTFTISAPMGNFYYEPLRDARNIIALVGGSGITPFIAMAEAIVDGTLDCKLSILYGAKTESELLFKNKLNALAKKSDLIQVKFILSEEENPKYEPGFITKDMIEVYMQKENSFFVCGPLPMYEAMNDILKEFNLPNKYIRHDAFFGKIDLDENGTYNLTVITKKGEVNIPCKSRETLLVSMEKNGIEAPSKCHVGECGFCRSKLIAGRVKMLDDYVLSSDKDYEYIHPCVSFPESDIVLKLPF